ncbi:MAG: GWxTD domain-containing protein [Acidobacteriota bacterium]
MLWWAEPASAQGAGLGAQAWRETPVRWLMTPGEARQVSRLRDDLELAQFMDAFWKRRDPDPSQAGNEFQLEFRQRVELADLLYGSDAARGSLSPRGGAFILLGPPSHLSQGFQTIPRLGVSRRATGPQARGTLQVETWSWRPEDLSPRLRALLERKGWSIPLSMTFHLRPSQVSLAEGDDLMELAARSYLQQE